MIIDSVQCVVTRSQIPSLHTSQMIQTFHFCPNCKGHQIEDSAQMTSFGGRRGGAPATGPPSTLHPMSPGEGAASHKQASTPGRSNTIHEPPSKYPSIPMPPPKDPVSREEVLSLEAWNKLDALAKSTPYILNEDTNKIQKGSRIERWSDRYTQHGTKEHAVKLAKAMDTDPAFFPDELHGVLMSAHNVSMRERKDLSFEEVLSKKLDTLDTKDDDKERDESKADDVPLPEVLRL